MIKETPAKLSSLFDDPSDLSTMATANNSAFQTPRRGGATTPLRSPYKTPLRSPYRGRMGRVNHKISLITKRVVGSGFVWWPSLLFSIFGILLCSLIAKPVFENITKKCEDGQEKYWGKCIGDDEKKAWDLRNVTATAMRRKAKGEPISIPQFKQFVAETDDYKDLDANTLVQAIDFCDDFAIFGDQVYFKLAKKTEYIIVVVFTMVSLVICISSSIIRSNK